MAMFVLCKCQKSLAWFDFDLRRYKNHYERVVCSELVTTSGSGVDPHISPKAALYQVKSIVQARKTAGWKLTVNERGETQVVPPQKVPETDLKNLTDYSEDFVRR